MIVTVSDVVAVVLVVRWCVISRWYSSSLSLTWHQAASVRTHQEVHTGLEILLRDRPVDPASDPRRELVMSCQRHGPVSLQRTQRHGPVSLQYTQDVLS